MDITAAWNSGKAAIGLATGLISLSKEVAVKEKALELLTVIQDLQQKIHELETELRESLSVAEEWKQKALKREAWEQKKAAYKTHQPIPGVLVYITEPSSSTIRYTEWYCKHCADIEMVPSTLQMVHHSAGGKNYQCHNCKFEFTIRDI